MIIATVTALYLIFGGGNWWVSEIKSVEKIAKQVLPADERRDAVLDAFDEMKDLAKARGKVQKETADVLAEVIEDHGSDEAVLREILSGYRSDTVVFYQTLAAQRMALKEQLTEQEWAEIYEAVAAED